MPVTRIVLFGSCASGREREGSDIDIIVISKAFENKDIFQRVAMAKGVHGDLVAQLRRPVDLLFYSESEWAAGRGLIVSQVKKALTTVP